MKKKIALIVIAVFVATRAAILWSGRHRDDPNRIHLSGNIELTEPRILHGMFYNPGSSRRDHVACFVVQAFHQSAPPAPNREIAASRFFALEELPGDTGAG